jgi:hypothetical protein
MSHPWLTQPRAKTKGRRCEDSLIGELIWVNAKRPMGHCFKELEELPMAEAGESARVRWRETNVKRVM